MASESERVQDWYPNQKGSAKTKGICLLQFASPCRYTRGKKSEYDQDADRIDIGISPTRSLEGLMSNHHPVVRKQPQANVMDPLIAIPVGVLYEIPGLTEGFHTLALLTPQIGWVEGERVFLDRYKESFQSVLAPGQPTVDHYSFNLRDCLPPSQWGAHKETPEHLLRTRVPPKQRLWRPNVLGGGIERRTGQDTVTVSKAR